MLKDTACPPVDTPVLSFFIGMHLTTNKPSTQSEKGALSCPFLLFCDGANHDLQPPAVPVKGPFQISQQSEHLHARRLTHAAPRRFSKPCTAAAAQGATQRGRRPKQQQEGPRQQQQDNEGGSRSSEPRSGADSTAASSAAGWQPDADDGEKDGARLLVPNPCFCWP